MSLVLPAWTASVSRMVSEVANADALAKQVLQDALELARPEQPGHDLADQRRRGGTNPVEQPFDLLAGQELVGVVGDDLAEMVRRRRPSLVDAAAGEFGDLSAVGVNPDRGLTGQRVDPIAAVGTSHQSGRRHGQQPARISDPLPDDGPANLDSIFVGRKPISS